ncbi:MAG TPA: hypothetical protein VHE56_12095 [Mycobacteriales bacterium]|nr:hypothetical protein [Mycobacteriales bacterium]
MSELEDRVRGGFIAAGIPDLLVNELLDAFAEAKRRFHSNDLRPQAVEGGRFSEAVFRVLQWATTGAFTPVGKTLPTVDKLLETLRNSATGNDSVRLHIPRTLRLIYDVRNKRDAAHLADGIDPNFQDATLVIRNMDWVLAELVRLYHNVSANQAQQIINDLVAKDVPVIQEVDGFPRVLRELKASDYVLVLLTWRGAGGSTFQQLREWVRPKMRTNLRRTLEALDAKNFIHLSGDTVTILRPGEKYVEDEGLVAAA